ncbi:MAG: glycosyltransferase family 4 protein [Flavobacteriales bacterium]
MSKKPELIIFSQNLMGGGSSFHRNMIKNKPNDFFDIQCIYHDPLHWNAARSTEIQLNENDVIFKFGDEPEYEIAKRLNQHISNKPGAIVTNLPEELYTLTYFPKSKKTIYFICHDIGFLSILKKHQNIIDVFIAHNHQVYEAIVKSIPHRKKDIYFIQHGVEVQGFPKKQNKNSPLNLVFLARHVKIKGIYDLPKIDDSLLKKNISVNWTILGDGEERENFINQVKNRKNFSFIVAKNAEEIINILKYQDLYTLPSSHDGLPVSMLEAMSVGCVPITYNFSEGIKKVVTDDIGNVVELHDYIAMSDCIEKYNADRDLLFEFSNNCIQKVNTEFNIKTQANEYFKLYKDYKKHRNNHQSLNVLINKYRNKNKYIRKAFTLLNMIRNYTNA